MAPEILFSGNETLSYKCDLWSVGIILHELMYNCHPFGKSIENIIVLNFIKKNKRIIVQDKIEIVEDFLSKVLVKNQEKRMDWV